MNGTVATTVYHDPLSGDWIAELRAIGQNEWTRVGVYGSREAAQDALDDSRPYQSDRRTPRQ